MGSCSLEKGIRRRPTLPGRCQPSTIGAERLNFCVRDGNRWVPLAIATGSSSVVRRASFARPHPESCTGKFDLGSVVSSLCRSSPRPISISKLIHYCIYTADLSTLSSARGLTCSRSGSLILQVGFTLRCLQRLSHPHFASQLCRWHDNCFTRGASIPVLSY